MNIERTQHIGHYGVPFTVIRLTVLPTHKHALANICLLEAGASANEVRHQLLDLHEKMFACDLPCKMTVAISKPLTRQHADPLNERGTVVASLIASAVSAPLSRVSALFGGAAGGVMGLNVRDVIHSYHAADVVIGIDAQVTGGIGPQRSLSAMVRQFQGG